MLNITKFFVSLSVLGFILMVCSPFGQFVFGDGGHSGYGKVNWGNTYDEVEAEYGELIESRIPEGRFIWNLPEIKVYATKEDPTPFDFKSFCFYKRKLYQVVIVITVPNKPEANRIMDIIQEKLEEKYGKSHRYHSDSHLSSLSEGHVDSSEYWDFPRLSVTHLTVGPWMYTKRHFIVYRDPKTEKQIKHQVAEEVRKEKERLRKKIEKKIEL